MKRKAALGSGDQPNRRPKAALAARARTENRARLERETREYFERLSPEALKEEQELAGALSDLAVEIDPDSD